MMRSMVASPNIYNIPANEDFFQVLADGIINSLFTTCNTKDVIILLPTKNACSSLKNVFFELGYKKLNIHSVSDLADLVTLKKQSTVLSRIGLVAKVSEVIFKMNLPKFKDLSSITPLAEYFANFIQSIEFSKVDLSTILKMIDEDLSNHQQELFIILKEFIALWRQEDNLTKVGYNNLLIEKLSNSFSNKTIIMAGISYNTPSIIQLMKKSYLVFYGIDSNFTMNDWENVDVTHAQYNFKQILSQLNVDPQAVTNFCQYTKKRSNLISHALKPSKSCVNWYSLAKESIDGIQYLKCNDLHHEAKSIVSLLQNRSYKTAMVVTADDALMVKIILNLKQSNLDVNIIRDYPLKHSDTGIWLELCLNIVLENFSLSSSLALLKHKLANVDQAVVLEIELLIRDKNFYGNNIFAVSFEDENFNLMLDCFRRFKDIFSYRSISFKELFEFHLNFAQEVARLPLWEGSDAEEFKLYLDQILESSGNLGSVSPKSYPQVFQHFIQSAYYRPEVSNHKITLSKPIDARLHRADLVILAGLNEGIWPSRIPLDPCFNNSLLEKIGLPSPEQAIGEEAYDFQCFVQNPQIVLTRSEKDSGVITTPSRWLLRMLTLINIEEFSFAESAEDSGLQETYEVSPRPAIEHRPTQLSVTQIDKLVFNPYHIYVDLILKLKKLPPIVKSLSALDFGIFIHRAIEIYHYKHIKSDLETLLNSGKQALMELNLTGSKLQLIYWQRFVRIAKWFIANENLSNIVYLEEYGRMPIGNKFTLIARADRIEVSANNSLHIIDYKTGRLPTNKAITSGNSLQLLLEGVIGKNGGFKFQRKHQNLASLTYLQLSGGEGPVEVLEIDISDEEIIKQTEEYIHALIKQYQDISTPYHYTNKKSSGYCEYAHLAREF